MKKNPNHRPEYDRGLRYAVMDRRGIVAFASTLHEVRTISQEYPRIDVYSIDKTGMLTVHSEWVRGEQAGGRPDVAARMAALWGGVDPYGPTRAARPGLARNPAGARLPDRRRGGRMSDAWLSEQMDRCHSLLSAATYARECGDEMARIAEPVFRDSEYAIARGYLSDLRKILIEVVARCGGWPLVPGWHAVMIAVAMDVDVSMLSIRQ